MNAYANFILDLFWNYLMLLLSQLSKDNKLQHFINNKYTINNTFRTTMYTDEDLNSAVDKGILLLRPSTSFDVINC